MWRRPSRGSTLRAAGPDPAAGAHALRARLHVIVRLAVRAEFHGNPPPPVAAWLELNGVEG